MVLPVRCVLVSAGLLLGAGAGCAGSDTRAPAERTAPEAASAPADSPASQPAPRAEPPAAAAETQPSADMTRIREAMTRSPTEALELIDRADALHPGDEAAEERAWLRVDALVAAQQIGRARAAAETFLRRYPKSAQAERIRALTGVHLRPLGPRE